MIGLVHFQIDWFVINTWHILVVQIMFCRHKNISDILDNNYLVPCASVAALRDSDDDICIPARKKIKRNCRD